MKQGVNHTDINEENLDKETLGRLTDWIHSNHFTDNKLNNDRISINDMTVDIGQNGLVNQWFQRGSKYNHWWKRIYHTIFKTILQQYQDLQDPSTSNTHTKKWILIFTRWPIQQQQAVVLASNDTIGKYLNNNTKYKPLRATIMGCGGTGKSFIINTIISIVQNMTQLNDLIIVGVPTGAAAFNLQGSTLHHLNV